jgi:pimeloyl-ACP methyl ester carboxylesterase
MAVAPAARAAGPLSVCGDHGKLECGRVAAPLDPSGRVPGRVEIYVKRFSEVPHPSGTVMGLAGGPGQSAISVLPLFVNALQPILGDRALVVFDERGIGRSQPLTCRTPFGGLPVDPLLGRCARELAPRDRFYATTDTVSDIEHVRAALSIPHLTLYGASYGTFSALSYARAHPNRVDHLVLDSVVPPTGEPAFDVQTIQAIRRVLATLCAAGCNDMAPLTDAGRLFARGDREARLVTQFVVSEAVLNGDFSMLLRSFVAPLLHLAVGGDRQALGRLNELQNDLYSEEVAPALGPSKPNTFNLEPVATLCEDSRFPWRAQTRATARIAAARAALRQVPESALAPFDHDGLAVESPINTCLGWPAAGNRPDAISGPLPDVPTLILSGAEDVRTPTEGALALAHQLPRATLLVVPNVGHSVLRHDPSGCATRGLIAFLAGTPVAACPVAAPLPVDPLPPSLATLSLTALPGQPGRVVTAALLTVRHDLGLIQPLLAGATEPVAGTTGGLVGEAPNRTIATADLSYIGGVTVSGQLAVHSPYDTGTLEVKEGRSVTGELTFRPDGSIIGEVSHQRLSVPVTEREAQIANAGLAGVDALFDSEYRVAHPRA